MWLSESDLAAVQAPKPEFGVAGITAGQARASGFWIQKTFEQGNPNHCELGGQVSNGKREKISKSARWVRYPEGYPDEFKGELWALDAD